MANWEPPRAPRTSSRLPAPGVFINVEFGVSFSNNRQPHVASAGYTSRRMQERLLRQRRQQEEHLLQQRNMSTYRPYWDDFGGPHPVSLMPGGNQQYSHHSHQEHHQPQQQYQSRRPSTRSRDNHERTSSAPPSLSDRSDPVSPMGTISTMGFLPHTSSMPLEGAQRGFERPLPPLPSRFRLGEDDLPWTTEPWYLEDTESEYEAPTMVGIENENESSRGEDPQRVRDLEALHQAMMSVDALPSDGWEPWTWDTVEEMPRGPRSLGWAVRTDDPPSGLFAPPPYVVSQWEQSLDGGFRPRSSG